MGGKLLIAGAYPIELALMKPFLPKIKTILK